MSFSSPTRSRLSPVLPLAGMIDIVFLLLILFVTVSTVREREWLIDVSLPATQAALPAAARTQTVVTVTADGSLYLGDVQRPLTPDELRARLAEVARFSPAETVVVRGDQSSRLADSVRVIDIARSVGIQNVHLATVRRAP